MIQYIHARERMHRKILEAVEMAVAVVTLLLLRALAAKGTGSRPKGGKQPQVLVVWSCSHFLWVFAALTQ